VAREGKKERKIERERERKREKERERERNLALLTSDNKLLLLVIVPINPMF